MSSRKIFMLGFAVIIIAICVVVLFAEKVSFEQKTSYIKIEKFEKTQKDIIYLVGKDPYIFNSEVIHINVSEKQQAKLEVGGVYMLKYNKVTEGNRGSYVLEKIGEKKE